MGIPVHRYLSSQQLCTINLSPGLGMADLERIRLNPPPTKKWVKFNDWDEEAVQFKPRERRHSSHDVSNLSSSVSSVCSVSSLGSAGEGSRKSNSRFSTSSEEPSSSPPATEPVFNSSFGGYNQNGDAAALRALFTAPTRLSRFPASSFSSQESGSPLRSPAATVRIQFSEFNEMRDCETTRPDPSFEESSIYSAFDEVRRDGVYVGWSNNVLGDTEGWSEDLKSSAYCLRPLSLSIEGRSEEVLSGGCEGQVTVETLSTPEMTGIRTISWPRSPTRSFVRNFP